MSEDEQFALQSIQLVTGSLIAQQIAPGDVTVALAAHLSVMLGNITDDAEREEGLALIMAEIPAMVETVAEEVKKLKKGGRANLMPDHGTRQ